MKSTGVLTFQAMKHTLLIARNIVALSVFALQACGGGSSGGDAGTSPPAPEPLPPSGTLVDTSTIASGGTDSSRVAEWVVTVDGPQFSLTQASNIEVCAFGSWVQSYAVGGFIDITATSLAPGEGSPRMGIGVDAFGAASTANLSFSQCNVYALTAGLQQLRYRIRVYSSAGGLSNYSTNVRWRVRVAS
jgi:hypothetical protein